MTDPRVVEALKGALPHEAEPYYGWVATDLPSIVRATVPVWDAAFDREVAEAVLTKMAERVAYTANGARYVGSNGHGTRVDVFVRQILALVSPQVSALLSPVPETEK